MMIMRAAKSLVSVFCKNSSNLGQFHISFALSFSHSFSTSSNTHSVSDFLLHKHNFSPETVSKVASVLTCLKNPEKSDSVLKFLRENGFSKTDLEKILRSRPRLLSSSLENIIKPKIKIFQDLGISSRETAQMITRNPTILYCSADNRVLQSLAVLKSLVGSDANVAKLLKKSSWFVAVDLQKILLPNVKFLESCGVSRKHIIDHIYFCPRFFLHKPEVLRKCVDKVDKMGVSRSSKCFIYAVRIVSFMSKEIWELKLRAFRNIGFSEDDVLRVFRTAPQVFSVSAEKMERVNKLLIASAKYYSSCIANNPKSLMYSCEDRYKPRLQVLGHLQNRNLLEEWPGLQSLYSMPDEKFFEKFIHPYFSEIDEVSIPECFRRLKKS